ncbi:MAG: hypothetical protein QXH80_03665, partial [Candidatus Nanoarchaeia archaeon]
GMISLRIDVDKKERMFLDLPSLRDIYTAYNKIKPEEKPKKTWVDRAAEFDPYTIYTSLIVEKIDIYLIIALKKLLLNSPHFEKLKIIIDDFEEFEITKKEPARKIYEKLIE